MGLSHFGWGSIFLLPFLVDFSSDFCSFSCSFYQLSLQPPWPSSFFFVLFDAPFHSLWPLILIFKRVKSWTTMDCHVYDSTYCRVMTIAICNMQSEDVVVQSVVWKKIERSHSSTKSILKVSWPTVPKPTGMLFESYTEVEMRLRRWWTERGLIFSAVRSHWRNIPKPISVRTCNLNIEDYASNTRI